MCVLGLLFANTAASKIVIKRMMFDHLYYVLIEVTNYEIYNNLCLNKLTYMFLKLSSMITAASLCRHYC